jgi:hypothetical protein
MGTEVPMMSPPMTTRARSGMAALPGMGRGLILPMARFGAVQSAWRLRNSAMSKSCNAGVVSPLCRRGEAV